MEKRERERKRDKWKRTENTRQDWLIANRGEKSVGEMVSGMYNCIEEAGGRNGRDIYANRNNIIRCS